MRLVALAVLVIACKEPIDDRITEDYTTWKRIDVTGEAPGHADTYRIIYVNAIAADPMQDFTRGAQPGAVIVKEIRKNVDGEPGDLSYIAIMRRLDRAPISEAGGGWLFSRAEEPGGSEVHQDFCWARCHVAAPYNGAWYDYRDAP
jgi:Cytochrome P460